MEYMALVKLEQNTAARCMRRRRSESSTYTLRLSEDATSCSNGRSLSLSMKSGTWEKSICRARESVCNG